MSDSGHELRDNNEKIVKLMAILRRQRDEMNYLIEKQELEKGRIETEIEKLTFKLSLLKKSLTQRIQARNNYDRTIKEIEENYSTLVEESGKLLFTLNKEVHQLEQLMDKKTGTPEEHPGDAGEKRASSDFTETTLSDDEAEGDVMRQSSDITPAATEPYKDLKANKQGADKLNKTDVGPIHRHRTSDDVELQSYREAYSRQHHPQSPTISVNGNPVPQTQRRGSVGRRTSRRKSQDLP